MRFILAIVPPEPVYSTLRSCMEHYSRAAQSTKALQFPPHCTLMGQIEAKQAYIDVCHESLSKRSPFTLSLPKVSTFPQGILYYAVEPTLDLLDIHYSLLDIAVEHRTSWHRNWERPVDEQQKEYISRYGSPYVREFYTPHITVAGPDGISVSGSEPPLEFLVTAVSVLVQQNKQWNVQERIELQGE